MSIDIFDTILDELAAEEKLAFRKRYQNLVDLVQQPVDLQGFLDGYTQAISDLFAANAAMIWFREEGKASPSPKSQVGLERLLLEDETLHAHDRLVSEVLKHKTAVLVKPFSALAPHATSSNPTDSYLLFGPVQVGGETIAVVEIALGPRPVRGQSTQLRRRYIQWMDHLVPFLGQGIQTRFLNAPATLQSALNRLTSLNDEVESIQRVIRERVEESLQAFAGKTFGSLKANQQFAKSIHDLLDSYGLRVVCPECGSPAILRCQKAGNSKTGAFVFDHYLSSGRTFHGGPSTVPSLKLVPKPPRRQRQA